ncbi:hypothetical protein A8135_07375 [Legionella jamestowniensis]|uniref:Uncharacterized protein n=2 Tax=Legionella jamestowniensis TaxID=455 RepID=A0A0W0UIQ4_9GAMM|nr:hypothetical protein Ljam_1955 [Legionella jamestowniensis]OCH99493.1 hypothetical protein A8135_07375 [Legionella jamestowniensis]SFL61749.1 hypothetical protein SAMN02746073_1076 [Legionella jamestowniensis DSM 19215]
MTILSKEALEKIKKEKVERDEEHPDDIDALFREMDKNIEEKKEQKEQYNPFAEGEFDTFPPDTD